MLTFSDFLEQIAADPTFAVTAVLTLAVILVNGWTDAPNAIATCVATGAIGINAAIGMAAICNLAGVLTMAYLNPAVTAAICNLADFGTDAHAASIALCAAQFAVVSWVLEHGGLASQRARAMRSSRGSQVLPSHLPAGSHA